MYGWRGRIGIVVPSGNNVMEPEFNQLASQVPGLAIHCARVRHERQKPAVQSLLDMKPLAVDRAAPDLKDADIDIILYGCTSGSFSGGAGWDQEIVESIRERVHLPVTTASTAVVAALNKLDVQRIALGTPYTEEVTELGKAFLEREGFEVVNTISLNNVREVGDASSNLAYQLGCDLNSPSADCILISCTKFPSITVIEALEKDLEKPVISSNVASFWHALQILGIRSRLSDYGSLLGRYTVGKKSIPANI